MKQIRYWAALIIVSFLISPFSVVMQAESGQNDAIAQTSTNMTPKTALERLFTTSEPQADWFTSAFLSQVPLSQLQMILRDMQRQLGSYQSVQQQKDNYQVAFEKGTVPTQISLNAEGQITGLFFRPPQLTAMTPEDAIAKLKTLPGQTSLAIWEGKIQKTALNADQPLAVGSTFKLAVLKALKAQIAAKKLDWDTVVRLQRKSLPSGILQTWPNDSQLTVESLATLMISQSDNTATDALIDLVGRSQIEALSSRNRPFLTTREAFILKSPKNKELRDRYLANNLQEKRTILSDLPPLPKVSDLGDGLISPEIEWFFSTQELCQLMAEVEQLPLMQVNPGLAIPKDWSQISYKGGSEPGVLNYTTYLKTEDGRQYCVSATWNHDQPLDEAKFSGLYGALLRGLK